MNRHKLPFYLQFQLDAMVATGWNESTDHLIGMRMRDWLTHSYEPKYFFLAQKYPIDKISGMNRTGDLHRVQLLGQQKSILHVLSIEPTASDLQGSKKYTRTGDLAS